MLFTPKADVFQTLLTVLEYSSSLIHSSNAIMQSSYRELTATGFSVILQEKYSTAQKMIGLQVSPMTPTPAQCPGQLNHNKFLSCPHSFLDVDCQHFTQAHFNLPIIFLFLKFRSTLPPIASLSSQELVQNVLLPY